MSLFQIKCPMCKGTLWIDPSTQKVVDHQSADHQKADFGEFLKNRDKKPAWDDRLTKAKEDERKRKEEIDRKFKAAKDDPSTLPDEGVMKSPFDWD